MFLKDGNMEEEIILINYLINITINNDKDN